MELEGKVGIVTGSAKGLGKAIALKLAKEGCAIVASDIDSNGAGEVIKEIRSSGRTVYQSGQMCLKSLT